MFTTALRYSPKAYHILDDDPKNVVTSDVLLPLGVKSEWCLDDGSGVASTLLEKQGQVSQSMPVTLPFLHEDKRTSEESEEETISPENKRLHSNATLDRDRPSVSTVESMREVVMYRAQSSPVGNRS